jgi:hypothetical protein
VRLRRSILIVIALAVGCGREPWPNPPAVEPTKYEADHRAWREDQRGLLSDVLKVRLIQRPVSSRMSVHDIIDTSEFWG